MLRSIACASILAFLAATSGAREQTSFRAAQSPDAKTTPEDRRKIIDELRLKYQAAVEELAKNNTGESARARQKDILDLLDKLLNQESDPPPNSNPPASDPPPAGQENTPSPKTPSPVPNKAKKNLPAPAPNTSAESAAPRKEAERKQGQGEPERAPLSLEEVQKQNQVDPWRPKLPARAGQDIDAYARERFIPRYEELLRAYYRTLAESSRRKDSD